MQRAVGAVLHESAASTKFWSHLTPMGCSHLGLLLLVEQRHFPAACTLETWRKLSFSTLQPCSYPSHKEHALHRSMGWGGMGWYDRNWRHLAFS